MPSRRSLCRLGGLLVCLAPALRAGAGVTIGLSFQGSTISESGFIPPDTMGAIGPGHFVELINGRYAVYRKTDGAVLDSSSLDGFWIDAGVVPVGSFSFDPRVLYDHDSGRWFAVAVDNPGDPNRFLVAVTATSDPLDGWTGFAIDSDTDDAQWADFPTVGLDGNGLYVAGNMFGDSFAINVLVLPKADLLLPSPTVAGATLLEDVASVGFALQPVVSFDAAAGFEVPVLAEWDTAAGLVRRSNLTGSLASPMLVPETLIGITAHPAPPDAEQPPLPTPKEDIHTGDLRFGGNVILRDGVLWAVHTVGVSGRAAVQFLRIDAATDVVLQDTLIADAELAFYYPSIAVNGAGQCVIGFSGSGADQPVSAYAVAGETAGGVTSLGAPILLRAGLDDYERLDGSGRNRWGDYSATTLDPTDPQRFWTIQEFVLADDVWATQVTELILDAPCVWDLDGDGTVGTPDFLGLLAAWGPNPGHPADFDGDGLVSTPDFLALLANWGSCP